VATWTPPGHIISGQTAGVSTVLQTYETDLLVFNQAWTTYTPVVGGGWLITGGTPGTITGRHCTTGKLCSFRIQYTIGATDTKGTNLTMTLPFAASGGAPSPKFIAHVNHTGEYMFYGVGFVGSAQINIYSIASTMVLGQVTATAPFTWATGDIVEVFGTYETS
jgi:hypothetical protein